jgi:two-component system, LuxR family, response regulator FixJ
MLVQATTASRTGTVFLQPVVVVVDDDPAVRNSLKFALEVEGFAVRTYGSAAELFRAGDVDACDCFVVDQRMPDLSGVELIAQLRDRHIATPAILLASQATASLSTRAALANIPIVEKPLLGSALVDRIREACRPAN